MKIYVPNPPFEDNMNMIKEAGKPSSAPAGKRFCVTI